MSRPAVARTERSLRLRSEVDAELVRQAKAAGRSVNAHVEALVQGDGYATATYVDQPPLTAAELNAAIPCPHPKRSRKVHSWGARCGDCGQRL